MLACYNNCYNVSMTISVYFIYKLSSKYIKTKFACLSHIWSLETALLIYHLKSSIKISLTYQTVLVQVYVYSSFELRKIVM